MKIPWYRRAAAGLWPDIRVLLHVAFGLVLLLAVFSYARAAGFGDKPLLVLLAFGSAYWVIRGVFESQQRLRALIYALFGAVLFVTVYIGMLLVITRFISIPAAGVSKILNGIQALVFLPAAIGANLPPRRK